VYQLAPKSDFPPFRKLVCRKVDMEDAVVNTIFTGAHPIHATGARPLAPNRRQSGCIIRALEARNEALACQATLETNTHQARNLMDNIKLTYFDVDGGRAEPARLALSMAGIDFEDHRISFPEFKEMRESTPLNAVPVAEINGVAHTQCNAMNRYFGKLAGLYPSDPWQAFLCDEVLEIIEDASVALSPTIRLQGEKQKKAREELAQGLYTRILKTLDKRLQAGGGRYFADGRLTMADIKVFLWIRRLKSGGVEHLPADLPDTVAPHLVEHMERIAAEPGIAAYYASRSKS